MPAARPLRAPKPARSYHHGNLRAALIEAGLKLIEEKGVRALTLREIGNRLNVSRMAPYRHFSDKSELLAAICEAGFSQFADALEQARDTAEPNFASRLQAMGVAYVRFASEHKAHFEAMFGPGADATVKSARKGESGQRAFRILEETLREGQMFGEVRSGDSVQLARIAWSLVHGISMLELEPFNAGAEPEFTVLASKVLIAGLRPGIKPHDKH